jgi:hypothetical protein
MKASNSKAEIRSQMSPESKGSTLPALKGGKILLNSRYSFEDDCFEQ